MPDVLRLRLWIGLLLMLAGPGLGEGLRAQPRLAGGPDTAYDLEDDYLVRTWTTSEGLPANYVSNVYQTSDGYLWLGTGGGVVRFDGQRFRVFTPDELGWSRVFTTALHEDATGTLWALSRNDELAWIEGDRVRRPPPEVYPDLADPFFQDAAGRLWLHTEDEAVRVRGDTVRAFPKAWLPERRVLRLAFDVDGRLWGAEGDSVYAVRPARPLDLDRLVRSGTSGAAVDVEGAWWFNFVTGVGRIQDGVLTTFSEADGLPMSNVRVLDTDEQGRLRIAGKGGVAVWEDGAFTPLEGIERLPHGNVTKVFETSSGALFFGDRDDVQGRREDLFRYERGRLERLPLRQHLSYDYVLAVLEDDEGNLWIGTDGGLLRLTPRRVQALTERDGLPEGLPMPLLQTSDGAIWIGTYGGGLARLGDGRLRTYEADEPWGNRVRALYEDGDGQLWIGTYVGAARLRDGKIDVVVSGLGKMQSWSFLRDREGRLWLGTESGLFEVNERTGASPDVRQVEPGLLLNVWALHEDERGRLWVGTENGLFRRDGERWQRFSKEEGLERGYVVAFHEDGGGTLWLGTFGGGLLRYRDGRFFRFGPEHGLPDPNALGIAEDDEGHLWISSYRGIYRAAKEELADVAAGRQGQLHPLVLTEADGLPSSECNRASPSALRSADGRLWFPTMRGVAHFDPAEIGEKPPPKVHVERVAADGVPVPPRDLEGALDVRARNLAFGYTGIHLAAPERVRFRYRLDGVDVGWVEAGTERGARYANLAPGRYAFRVAAATPYGAWSEAAVLPFQIKPFFYETTWFYLLCSLLSALAVAGAFRLREQHLRRHTLEALVQERTSALEEEKQKTEAQAERLREMDRTKSRFFANVSHEFKTPLTMILGPIQDLLNGRAGAVEGVARRQLELVRDHAWRLAGLTDQLLALSKLEAGRMPLRKAPGDLVQFVGQVVQSYAPLAEREGVALAFHAEADRLPCAFDADQLAAILGNLLSNALKFTPKGGKVLVTVAGDGADVQVRVRDTGRGIPAERLPHVFDRFYQADDSSTRLHEGVGIGLALAKELAELHGGTIEAASEEGFGSEFTVTLPAEEARPAGRTSGQAALAPDGRPPPTEWAGDGAMDVRAGDGAGPDADAPVVLIAEDHADVRAYLRRHLAGLYHVVEAANGREALALARTHRPDLVLSDVMMPEMDGMELCRALRADDDLGDVPVLLLTAKGGAENRVEGLGADADGYLEKPFEMAEVEARIRGLIERHRRLRARYGCEILVRPTDVRIQPAEAAFLEEARAVAEAYLHHGNFGADAFADAMHLTRATLGRKLKAASGLSPSAFVRHLRLERAAQLLSQNAGLPIREVAEAVGYRDADHFAKLFRKHFGAPPSQYAPNDA